MAGALCGLILFSTFTDDYEAMNHCFPLMHCNLFLCWTKREE